ncbi:hypothetical protein J2Z60_001852 [Lactobacillus colini]|uniref:DUF4767 domain-containing protein n=1 Tax=Lactobacillus colini TaxID=1819254 RepID=A0ABS4MG39_9LACO|nr:DUF4767 domain-containing protein [Lactobacillus colini]MBP2058664.1 hypothetical protein [Lactobacillus colini]
MKKVVLLGTMMLALSAMMTGCRQIKISDDGNNIIIGQDKKAIEKSKQKSIQKREQAAKSRKLKSELKKRELEEKAKVTWTTKKDKYLTSAMKSISKKQKITYTKYDGKHPLKANNVRVYPDTFKKGKFYLNNKIINIGWDPQADNKYDYRVLSIYNRDLGKEKHETYLFCLYDKNPIILVDSVVAGNKINLTKSNNKVLNKSFEKTMNGKF